MITSAISSAARLSLAPARLAGRMAGSLLRGLRGNDSGDASSSRSSARTTPAPRSRARTQAKRATTRSSAKTKAKRTAARARPKSQPSAARSKRTAARARPKSQPSAARSAASARGQAGPRRTAGPEPLSDVAIAREVESTIFRDVEVHQGQVDVKVAEGVVRLRGEVRTPDLINELEARAVRVPQVRRVENLLHTPAPPPETATPASKQVDPASTLGAGRSPSPASALRTRDVAAGAQAPGAAPAESASVSAEPRAGRPEGQAEPPIGARAGAPEPAAGRPEGNESADHDEPGLAEPDKDPTYQPRDQRTQGS
jgi:osmotically-inducible protein OsmY